MKNIFIATLLSLASIIIITACTQTPRSPADDVIKPSDDIMRRQEAFDRAMIEKANIKNGESKNAAARKNN